MWICAENIGQHKKMIVFVFVPRYFLPLMPLLVASLLGFVAVTSASAAQQYSNINPPNYCRSSLTTVTTPRPTGFIVPQVRPMPSSIRRQSVVALPLVPIPVQLQPPDLGVSWSAATTRKAASKTILLAKKKSSPSSSSSAPAASKKIQVKMLKHVAGTGSAGDVVLVTPAFFNNKLRPTHSAMIITDEQVKEERARADRAERLTNAKAGELREAIGALTLVLRRKAGPDGQLFGGIGAKMIVDELESVLQDDFLHQQKSVKVTAVTGADGNRMAGDIKHTGEFRATISLTKDIAATVAIHVEAEE
jgi:large subunit ribosomal protein L9